MDYFAPQVRGKTLGIIGFGRVGQQLAALAAAVGLRVYAFDISDHVPERLRAHSLEWLLANSDFVSLNASYCGQRILNAEEIIGFKPGAIFVNTARGELVDEYTLARFVRNGKLGGVAVDVLSGEHAVDFSATSHPLVQLVREGFNVVVTPHLGGCTVEAFEETQMAMVRHLLSREDSSR
jgi:D-3-phosphoglycerate dehydrogenase